jgi:hypothetical protein
LLNEGKDPLAERDQARRTEQEKRHEQDTFEVVAKEFVAKCRREGLSEITLWKKEWLLGLPTQHPRDSCVNLKRISDAVERVAVPPPPGMLTVSRRDGHMATMDAV